MQIKRGLFQLIAKKAKSLIDIDGINHTVHTNQQLYPQTKLKPGL